MQQRPGRSVSLQPSEVPNTVKEGRSGGLPVTSFLPTLILCCSLALSCQGSRMAAVSSLRQPAVTQHGQRNWRTEPAHATFAAVLASPFHQAGKN